MPKSPKLLHLLRSRYRHFRSATAFPFLCLALGFLLGALVLPRRVPPAAPCRHLEPISVSVAWDGGSDGGGGAGGFGERHKVMGFVGIQTGFASFGRRSSLRKTWMPSDHEGLQRLEDSTGLAFRFVIGRNSDSSKMAALRKEVDEYDDFILLDIEEEYSRLPYKTLAFFKAAYRLYDADFYIKADDDIYLRPDRLSLLIAKERPHTQTYLGCMKKGPVFIDPKLKWFEPLGYLLGREYFLHAYGPIYALSADIVASMVALKNDSFRMFSNEDVTIGAWMLAMNVKHEDNRELCSRECTETSIAVWDIPTCSGLCKPEEKLLELHQKEICFGKSSATSND